MKSRFRSTGSNTKTEIFNDQGSSSIESVPRVSKTVGLISHSLNLSKYQKVYKQVHFKVYLLVRD
jgi:hypothetical protein